MDDARLTEMERDYINLNLNEAISDEERAALARKVLEAHRDLIAEVRRLEALLEPSKTSGRYEDGRDYAYAEIIRIMDEAEDDFEAFGQIANLVGWTSPDWAIEHGAD